MTPMQASPFEQGTSDSKALDTRSPARHVQHVDYAKHNLSAVPRDLPADLTTLNLSNNSLTQLPPDFGRTFSRLRLLDVSGNQIAALPGDIGHLHCLRELNASHNALTGLPTAISSLHGLEVLNISNNHITLLPAYLGLLAQTLRSLLVDGNPFDKSQRDLIEPILTTSSRNAKKLAKAREREERTHKHAVKGNNAGRTSAVEYDLPSQSMEHISALRKLMSARLKLIRNPGVYLTPDADTRHSSTTRWSLETSVCQTENSPSASNRVQPSSSRNSAVLQSSSRAMPDEHMLSDALHNINTCQGNAVSGSIYLANRYSLGSAPQMSQEPSADDVVGPPQDAAKVSRMLWHLCDEWDLDPCHSEADRVKDMLARLQTGHLPIDGASGIDRVYRRKSPSAGNSQRMKILSELLVTEVTYVDTLKNVVGVYLNPMRESKVLSESELREIFSNIEVILAFHNDHFLPAITYAISNPDMAIGSVFLHHGAHLKLYSTYTNNHETSVRSLSRVSSRRSVGAFIQNARRDVTQIGQVGLDGHLLTPIQRLPRYRMLLTDLLGSTPVDHPDHETLYSALKELNRTIYEVNEKKRTFENQSLLQRIQEKVAGSSGIPLVAPHRVFMLAANFRLQVFSEPARGKRGDLKVRRIGLGAVYHFILFNDMIMQCTIIMNKKDLRLNRIYRLGTRVAPAKVICDNELRVVDSEGVLYLSGDHDEIRKWAQEINSRLA